MTELVTVEQADAVMLTLTWVGPLVGALVGLLAGYARKCPAVALWQGIAVGLLGPVAWTMWRFYSYRVRYNPATGVAGLHKVRVHALNALIFVVLGLVLGVIYRRFVFPACESTGAPDTSDDNSHEGKDASRNGG